MQTKIRKLFPLSLVMISQGLSTFANSIISLVIPWIVFYRTGSVFDAGLVAFGTGIAGVAGSLIGGVMIDWFGARRIAILSDILSAISAAFIPVCLFFNFLPLEILITIQILGTFFDGPAGTARDTIVPQLAKTSEVSLVRAVSLQETVHGMSGLIGPLVGGSILLMFGANNTLFITVSAFIVSAIAVVYIPLKTNPKNSVDLKQGLIDIHKGYISLKKDGLLWSITLFNIFFSALFAPLVTLILPAWFEKTNTDLNVLTTFLTLQASGFVCGSLVYAYFATRISQYAWIKVSSIASTVLSITLILCSPNSPFLMIVSFLLGLFSAGLIPIISTLYYARTHPHFLGRINGTASALSQIFTPFALLLFGFITEYFGPTYSLFCIAIGALMLALYANTSTTFKTIDHSINTLKI